MKIRILIFILAGMLFPCGCCAQSDKDSISVMFWNLENFFDWKIDSLNTGSSDSQFSSFGSRHWTKKKFYTKCNAIAKSILWLGSEKGNLPDVIGVAEVENAFVLKSLLKETALRKTDYEIVHFDSPDPRGIDVALLYRSSRLKLLKAFPVRVGVDADKKKNFLTRDILAAEFTTREGDSLAFLVNHHPSKYGGKSDWKRVAALKCLNNTSDSLLNAGFEKIVAMGDFNDTPDNEAFTALTTLSMPPLLAKNEGSIRFAGKWELIDLFFVSAKVSEQTNLGMEVLHIPFLMVRDTAHSGEKPFRTYSGPRYIGGVSDHCPIFLSISEEFY